MGNIILKHCDHNTVGVCELCRRKELTELRTANADLAKRLEEWKKRCESSRPGMKCTECDASQFADTMVEETKATKDRITELEAKLKLFAWLEDETLDLRCISYPTGGDDYDVGWVVIEHYQADPQEREIGCGATPAEAIKQALKRGE